MLPRSYYLVKEAAERQGMEKTAQAPWRAFIDQAVDHADLGRRMSKLVSTKPPRPIMVGGYANSLKPSMSQYSDQMRHVGLDISNRSKPLEELKTTAKRYAGVMSQFENRPYDRAILPKPDLMKQPLSSLDEQGIRARKKNMRAFQDNKNWFGEQPVGGEEWYPIHHGSEHSRITAFLNNSQGGYPTESMMNLGNGRPDTNKGIMAHSRTSVRSGDYATRAASQTGGVPAVLSGEIQGKYLYRGNPGSGFGDEYSIPREFAGKIRNPQIHTPNNDPTGYFKY